MAGLTWIIIAAIFRISSLAALTAAAMAPLYMFLAAQSPESKLWLAAFMAVLIYIRHRENIRRLLNGEEPHIGGGAAHPTP
jgi:glycerol-3-phosphate acyltransferase PlsY